MKKTVQVNLGGQIFTLDEDAYEILRSYLNQLGKLYDRSPGKDEIISDIELRIAELLLEKLNDAKQVITIKDINDVTAVMGNPEQFEADEDDYDYESGQSQHQYQSRNNSSRRLYRDEENAIAGGVCAGIGHYFGTDPVWIRLLLVLAVVFGGTGFLIYILMWILVPAARTTTEKLTMKGEPVNINSIGKSIEDEFNDISDRIKSNPNTKRYTNSVASSIDKVIRFAAEIFKGIFRLLGKIFGVAFFVIGMFCLVAIVGALVGVADFFHWGSGDWSNSMNIYEIGDLIFASKDWFVFALVGFVLSIAIPFLALAYGGFSLLFPKVRIPYLGFSFLGVWFLGIILVILSGFKVAKEFSKEDSTKLVYEVSEYGLLSDTITIDIGSDPFNLSDSRMYRSNRNDLIMKIEPGHILFGNVSFDIGGSKEELATIEVVKTSRASSFNLARNNAESIDYHLEIDSAKVSLDAFFKFPIDQMFRDQEVEVRLNLPVGKTVFLTDATKRIIDDIDNVQYVYDPHMSNHYWLMTKRGLVCLDCDERTLRTDGSSVKPTAVEININ